MQRQQADDILFTIYFNGTSFEMIDKRNLAGFLFHHTKMDTSNLTLGFNGCAVENGLFRGGIFGKGTQSQAKMAANIILEKIHHGHKVKVNCYGHSRGAISALFLAKMLGDFAKDQLEMNLVLLDAVPGNYVWTAKLDATQATLTNQTLDLSQCKNLNHVLTLYPALPLPAIACHAPLIPIFPSFTKVESEPTPGLHSATQYLNPSTNQITLSPEAYIAFIRVKNFFLEHGTQFISPFGHYRVDGDTFMDDEGLAVCYKKCLDKLTHPSTRECHSKDPINITIHPHAAYFNAAHRDLIAPQSQHTIAANLSQQPQQKTFTYDYTQPEFSNLLQTFIDYLIANLSKKSRDTEKLTILTTFKNQLKAAPVASFKQAACALRNILALALQQQEQHFFETTHSAQAAKTLLKQEAYLPLKRLILGTGDKVLCYRDLRAFVIGYNVPDYFAPARKQRLFELLSAPNANVCDDHSARYASYIKYSQ